jgi:hypothetical protein
MCLCASRLKIGRPPDAGEPGQIPAGILIGRFRGPPEGIPCAGRQSLSQWEKDISACGKKSSPSPCSSPRGEEKSSGTHIGLAVQPPNAAMSTDALCPQQVVKLCGSARDVWERPEFRTSPTKSKQMRFIVEMRRGCTVGEDVRERVDMSGGTRRGDSNLGGFAALRDKIGIFGGSRRESNQVQANFFSGALGGGARTSTGTAGYARSAGLLPNRYMHGCRAEGVKNGVSGKGPRFAAEPGRTFKARARRHAGAAASDHGGFHAYAPPARRQKSDWQKLGVTRRRTLSKELQATKSSHQLMDWENGDSSFGVHLSPHAYKTHLRALRNWPLRTGSNLLDWAP